MVLAETTVPDRPWYLVMTDFHCPSCKRYIVTVPIGTPIERGYCKGCGSKFSEQIAR